jgi:hypothetical protein
MTMSRNGKFIYAVSPTAALIQVIDSDSTNVLGTLPLGARWPIFALA